MHIVNHLSSAKLNGRNNSCEGLVVSSRFSMVEVFFNLATLWKFTFLEIKVTNRSFIG